MRVLVVLGLMLVAAPGWAQEGLRYHNQAFAFALEVPAGFVAEAGEHSFALPGRAVTLEVWAEPLRGPFAAATARLQRRMENEGWRVAEGATTPRWAEFSAVQGSRRRVVRVIPLCGGQSYAGWQLEFSGSELAELEPVIGQLGRGLRAQGC